MSRVTRYMSTQETVCDGWIPGYAPGEPGDDATIMEAYASFLHETEDAVRKEIEEDFAAHVEGLRRDRVPEDDIPDEPEWEVLAVEVDTETGDIYSDGVLQWTLETVYKSFGMEVPAHLTGGATPQI